MLGICGEWWAQSLDTKLWLHSAAAIHHLKPELSDWNRFLQWERILDFAPYLSHWITFRKDFLTARKATVNQRKAKGFLNVHGGVCVGGGLCIVSFRPHVQIILIPKLRKKCSLSRCRLFYSAAEEVFNKNVAFPASRLLLINLASSLFTPEVKPDWWCSMLSIRLQK